MPNRTVSRVALVLPYCTGQSVLLHLRVLYALCISELFCRFVFVGFF